MCDSDFSFVLKDIVTWGLTAISLFLSITALVFSRKEPPVLSPNGFGENNSPGHFSCKWKNNSGINIHGLTLLVNFFDDKLNEITTLKVEDKFMFSVGQGSDIVYEFPISDLSSQFFFRVRFKGFWFSRVPFIRPIYNQTIWYSAKLVGENRYAIYSTHKNEIDDLATKHKHLFLEYESKIDKKYREKL